MCGIAGIYRMTGAAVAPAEIKALTDAIAHRGPDGEGCWIAPSGQLGLGHRRLSILDLSTLGAQPMHDATGNLTIVFNGELFNFVELRDELRSLGHAFTTDTDTEVLLAAYRAWGRDCLHRFNGFWAFALWDEALQTLWLARDRFGIKPLYYLHQPGQQLVFGSETNQFKHLKQFTRRADSRHVSYLIQNCWGLEGLGKTLYEGVESLRPGYQMVVTKDGIQQSGAWWSTAANTVPTPEAYETQVADFKALFSDAIKLRLRSDVSIASALSGGLDSSSVYATIHHIVSKDPALYRLPKDWQKAFVATFPGTEQDERAYAEQVLEHVNGKGVFIDVNTGSKDLVALLLDSIQSYDTIYSTPLFILDGVYGKMRSHGITVSMDGHGVDEMLYGYTVNVKQAWDYVRSLGDTAYAEDLSRTYLEMLTPESHAQALKALRKKPPTLLQRALRRLTGGHTPPPTAAEPWFLPEHTEGINLPAIEVPDAYKGVEGIMYNTFHHTVLPTILRNFDKGAMRNSIEIRMPFLDYRLVQYVFSLPMKSKLGGGFTKRILRDAMKGILPEDIRTRKLKTGFNAPLPSWYRNELKTLLMDEVASTSFTQSSYFNGATIRKFVLEKYQHDSWTENDCFSLWPVLNAHLLLKN